MHDLFLRALRSERVERPPVWLMRQAGRYMPQYRELRKKHSLWKLFHDPQLAAAVTMQPVDILGVDAAILFSDILVIAEVLGLTISFPDQGGPRVEPPLSNASDVHQLRPQRASSVLWYVLETISLLKKQLTIPLIGFSGAPFTIASYLIDSTSKTAFEKTKRWMQEDPSSFHALLAIITASTIEYLRAQVEAGVDALQVFDSWANVLTEAEFREFSLPYLSQIIRAVQTPDKPLIVFCRDSSLRASALSEISPAAISFDWHRPIADLRREVPRSIAIQGNFDPDLLRKSREEISLEVGKALLSMQGESGWIANLGHGIAPDISLDHVRHFVNLIKQSGSLS